MEALGAVSEDGFFAYFDEEDAATMDTAIDQLDKYIKIEGPFDGIMGFSQGAGLAAMLILRAGKTIVSSEDTKDDSFPPRPFKCAVFLSAEPPANPEALKRGHIEWMKQNSTAYDPITIPTAHIWGCNDNIYPEFGPVLYELCDESQKLKYVHAGGHEVPGHKAKDDATKAVQAIRRVLDMVV